MAHRSLGSKTRFGGSSADHDCRILKAYAMLIKSLFILVLFTVGDDRAPRTMSVLVETQAECEAMAAAIVRAQKSLGQVVLAAKCFPAPPFKSSERAS